VGYNLGILCTGDACRVCRKCPLVVKHRVSWHRHVGAGRRSASSIPCSSSRQTSTKAKILLGLVAGASHSFCNTLFFSLFCLPCASEEGEAQVLQDEEDASLLVDRYRIILIRRSKKMAPARDRTMGKKAHYRTCLIGMRAGRKLRTNYLIRLVPDSSSRSIHYHH